MEGSLSAQERAVAPCHGKTLTAKQGNTAVHVN
jgi:hypothetical protein